MSNKVDILLNAFWCVHPVLETAIAITLFRRGQYRIFKCFFAYIVTQILVFAVVFPTYLRDLASVLRFVVLHRNQRRSRFHGYSRGIPRYIPAFPHVEDLGTVLFKWAGLVMLLVAGVVSVSNGSSDTAPWVQAIMTAQRCMRVIQVGMVLFLLLFARYLGVSRKQQSFGICLGFGIFATVELGLNASWTGYHLSVVVFDSVDLAAYNCALAVWLYYALRKSPAREAMSTLLRPQRWEHGLSDIHHPLPADSLIPMFEGMVDRALSRTPISSVVGKRVMDLRLCSGPPTKWFCVVGQGRLKVPRLSCLFFRVSV